MGSEVSRSRPIRPSVRQRERVARELRHACDDDRLSLNTFAARLDLVYSVHNESELQALVADLPEQRSVGRIAVAATAWASRWTERLSEAWAHPRTARLVLPTRERVLIGRARDCDCVLADPTASRRHASLTFDTAAWRLRDLGSANGTYLNGARVIDEIEVAAGDEVRFGGARVRLVSS